MKSKTGYCIQCGNTEPKPIIKNLCQYHYWLSKRGSVKIKVNKPVKINRLSKKRAMEYKGYSIVRKEYLDKNPYCEARIPGCTIQASEVHHKAGKIGAKLTDVSNFLAVCRSCHDKIEANPDFAKEEGFSLSRLNKDI